ncbi:P-loop containing nucleoside triphosphate hydrolase protein, partial [Mycena belliarum]
GSQLSSSNSLSILPSKPKIFHGRDIELRDIIHQLTYGFPRIAILGTGGIGKTSLAQAVIHHPNIEKKLEHRFFVSCDSANNSLGLGVAALLGAHLGLKPGKDLTKAVLKHFAGISASLLILDNLETSWEPQDSRAGVEEFLSLLTDIEQLALIITMRGAERPAKVQWSRPFLPPLKPLDYDAARQTFFDIAEDNHKSEHVDQLLGLADNLPLAVNLIAHLAADEGCPNVLSRWETEKTALLSNGLDKNSSLDASIALSLSSPRMYLAGAKDLLSLLSILPDGLSDIELLQCGLPIRNILTCKATLLGTSLAYINGKKRLRSLVPIRQHVLQLYPPSKNVVEPLRNHFHLLLELYRNYGGQFQVAAQLNQINDNLGNLHQLLKQELS